MKPNTIYLGPVDRPYYGFYVTRVWFAPWRFNVWAIELHRHKEQLASNISRAEAWGLLKLMGAMKLGDTHD
jgi:hypothetical protein